VAKEAQKLKRIVEGIAGLIGDHWLDFLVLGSGDVRLMFRYMQKITRSLKSIIERNENMHEGS